MDFVDAINREIPFIFLGGQGMQEGETRKKRTRHSTTARQKQRRVEPPTREDLPPNPNLLHRSSAHNFDPSSTHAECLLLDLIFYLIAYHTHLLP